MSTSSPSELRGAMPSLFDRLFDPDSQGTAARPWYGAEQLVAAIQRDLDDLLNTRRTDRGEWDGYAELHRSLLTYGFPDISFLPSVTEVDIQRLARLIEETIEAADPRLRDVRAEPTNLEERPLRNVVFRISGMYAAKPAPEMAFTTTVELSSGRQEVTPAGK